MTGRLRKTQQAPDLEQGLAGFPARPLDVQDSVYRSYSSNRGPGWYSSNGSGRFDLSPPHGTGYVADTVAMAIRERFGVIARRRVLSNAEVDSFRVAELTGINGSFGDVSSAAAAEFGVTGELTTSKDYELSRRWAAALYEEGYDGIRYVPRFTPGDQSAWAVFGKQGANGLGIVVTELSGREACEMAGFNVIQPPGSVDSVTTI
ncbi:MAG: RES family NAD+ phosphorylase [Gulosibacter sp.]|uniref:RES family NAD+ phosphorylase n=1 Tax=Gulosibacter sp. TaxID=2817531 RepID=UPI003F8E50AB